MVLLFILVAVIFIAAYVSVTDPDHNHTGSYGNSSSTGLSDREKALIREAVDAHDRQKNKESWAQKLMR